MPLLHPTLPAETLRAPLHVRRAILTATLVVILVAVATVLSLTPAGRRSAGSAARGPVPGMRGSATLIRYRGTGAAPAGAGRASAPVRPTTGVLRAEHSYGLQP